MKAVHVMAAMALLGLAGCTTSDVTAQSTPSTLMSAAPAPAPATAAAELAEPYSLMTHCGIGTAEFLGRHWVAVTPQELPELLPDVSGDGFVVQDFYTEGTMTVLDEDLIRFTLTEPTADGAGLTVDFVPAATPAGGWCQ